MHQLFSNLPLDIVIHVVPYLNPRDFVILRRVNKAHHELFTSETLCKIALRAFFDEPWLHRNHQGDANNRSTFDNMSRVRDNVRRGKFSSFENIDHVRRPYFTSVIGTDEDGNHIFVVVPEDDSSLHIYWLDGTDIQRMNVLRVFVDFSSRVVRSQFAKSTCNLNQRNRSKTMIPAYDDVRNILAVQSGKIVIGLRIMVSSVIYRAFFAVIDLAEVVKHASPAEASELPSPTPLNVWRPDELLPENVRVRVNNHENVYFPPGSEEQYAHAMQQISVNRHYVVYKDVIRIRAPDFQTSEHIVLLPLGDSVPTCDPPSAWTSLAQRVFHANYDTRTCLGWTGAVGADVEGRLCFALGPSVESSQPERNRQAFPGMFGWVDVYRVDFCPSSTLRDAQPSLTKIVRIPLYGIPEKEHSWLPDTAQVPPNFPFCPYQLQLRRHVRPGEANFRVAYFHPPENLPRIDRDRYMTVNLVSEVRTRDTSTGPNWWIQQAVIVASYTFPCTELALRMFLFRASHPDVAGIWAEAPDGGHRLRPDGDGYVAVLEPASQCFVRGQPLWGTPAVETPQELEGGWRTTPVLQPLAVGRPEGSSAAVMLPATELVSWFSVDPIFQNVLWGSAHPDFHRVTASQTVAFKIPVYGRASNLQPPKAVWRSVPKWIGDIYTKDESPRNVFSVGTYNPWYVILNFTHGTLELPRCHHIAECMQIRAIGHGWLVYTVYCPDSDSIYTSVVVRYD
ncbi:hypothetical protein BDZ91DRAFT_724911 [Kalaharituber pfeilii]|nr:hypothetical protein BDZ91DRAFT_724911 [Kalaharituber pfeilii]